MLVLLRKIPYLSSVMNNQPTGTRMKNRRSNLPFSIFENRDYEALGVQYIGELTTGTLVFFDPQTGAVYKWNPTSGYFRRNSPGMVGSWSGGDGRNALCTKNRIAKADVLSTLVHFVRAYRQTTKRRAKAHQTRQSTY